MRGIEIADRGVWLICATSATKASAASAASAATDPAGAALSAIDMDMVMVIIAARDHPQDEQYAQRLPHDASPPLLIAADELVSTAYTSPLWTFASTLSIQLAYFTEQP